MQNLSFRHCEGQKALIIFTLQKKPPGKASFLPHWVVMSIGVSSQRGLQGPKDSLRWVVCVHAERARTEFTEWVGDN